MSAEKHIATVLAHAGGRPDARTGAVVPGINPATTFARDETYTLPSAGHLYSRDDNDLYRQAEALIARMEGAEEARVFASGMAAIAAVFRSVPPGAAVVIQSGIYWGTTVWVRKFCKRNGIALIECDTSDMSKLTETLAQTAADMVFIETPSNPALKVTDIKAAAAAAHDTGAVLVVDATASTPLICRPMDFGADFVVHSATKALNGHSDVLAGVVSARVAASERWALIVEERHDAGAVLGSFEAWLLVRGLRTLALRAERMNANAMAVASFLDGHAKVERVLYPGLATHPGHDIAARQMTGGFGSLVSVLIKGGRDEALAVAGNLGIFLRATSLGGVESLVEHRYSIEGDATGVAQNLLRLSIGIEQGDDLIADLDQALSD